MLTLGYKSGMQYSQAKNLSRTAKVNNLKRQILLKYHKILNKNLIKYVVVKKIDKNYVTNKKQKKIILQIISLNK